MSAPQLLTILRSRLAIGRFDPDENGRMCPVAHILYATGCLWNDGELRLVFSRYRQVPDDALSLFEIGSLGTAELSRDAWAAIGEFDAGRESACLRLLADLGWSITIQEDEPGEVPDA